MSPTSTPHDLDPLRWKADPIPGSALYSKVWGSYSSNTDVPGSDVDYTGVYVAAPEKHLSLHPPSDTLTGEKPDYQIHEVGKFCNLLLKGNPGIIEMLFTERYAWFDPRWQPLRDSRRLYLCGNVVRQYLGYSIAQLHRLRHGKSVHSHGGIPGEKWCYHMVRTIFDAERIANGGEPVIWKTGQERETLMAIRTGLLSIEQGVKIAEETIARIDSKKPWPIPERADEAFLNNWLLWIRGVRTSL